MAEKIEVICSHTSVHRKDSAEQIPDTRGRRWLYSIGDEQKKMDSYLQLFCLTPSLLIIIYGIPDHKNRDIVMGSSRMDYDPRNAKRN